MPKLADLRKVAKDLQIAPSLVRGATTAKELQAIIDEHSGNGNGSKAAKKKTGKVKTTTKTGKTGTTTGKKRGRPKGSKNSTAKSAPAVKSEKSGKAKRQTTGGGNGGRNMLGKINYSLTEGWNPREGSAPDRIVKALRKFKGDREKVFNFLKPDVWDFSSKRMSDGSKRPKNGERYGAEEMLRYRIARTDWDFAIKTGQHEASEDRAEYGTAGTGEGIYGNGKKSKKSAKVAKVAEKKPTGKKRGRPAGSKNKTATKATTTTTGKKRGRPKGSKNKK